MIIEKCIKKTLKIYFNNPFYGIDNLQFIFSCFKTWNEPINAYKFSKQGVRIMPFG